MILVSFQRVVDLLIVRKNHAAHSEDSPKPERVSDIHPGGRGIDVFDVGQGDLYRTA